MTPSKGGYELVEHPNGTYSIRDTAIGQAMHSRMGPWQEAIRLYVDQSELTLRLARSPRMDELVLYDVGLGAAANAVAALWCRSELRADARPLRVISFENDLEGARFALQNSEKFPYLKGFEDALEVVLRKRHWSSGPLTWEIQEGDFFSRLQLVPPAETVFYDFYDPKTCPQLWSPQAFLRLRAKLTEAVLTTYTTATWVRVAMLLGGFFVGHGVETEMKSESTQFATHVEALKQPLGLRWLEQVRRSESANMPAEWEKILDHPQFAELT